MKKLLVIAILMLALVFTVVACTGGETTEDTTVGDTTVETPTDAPTEEPTDAPTEEPTDAPTEEPTEEPTDAPTEKPTEKPTEPPTEPPTEEPTADPAEPVWIIEPDALNTIAQSSVQTEAQQIVSSEVITEGAYTFVRLIASGNDDPYVAIIPLGSSYTMPNYLAVKYRTNSTNNGQFFMGSGAGWNGQGDFFGVDWNQDSEWNFMIVDITAVGLTSVTDGLITYGRFDFFAGASAEGDYIDIEYIAFFNTPEYASAYEFEKHPPYLEADDPAAGKKNHSFDTFYVNNQMYFPEDGGAGDKLTAQDNTITFAPGEAHDSMILRGWIGFEQPIDSFGYFLDNYEMVFNPDYTKPTEDGVKAAGGEHALRFEIYVPLAELKSNDHFAGFVAKLADGTIVRLRENITVDLADDITDTFISDVASNAEGTDLQASDLANFFTVTYGAGEPHAVTGGAYNYGGINEMFTTVDGLYAYTVNMTSAVATSMMFVRGTHVVHSVDLPEPDGAGLFPINNYYETDGNGHMGGAGVYAAIVNGQLNLYVKAYDDASKTHIALKKYTVDVLGTSLTIADAGDTLYVLAGDQLVATVALSGETTYEKICDVAEGVTFAQTAVVTLYDGTTETIENTMIVATYQSQIGMAIRGGSTTFKSVKVQSLSDVTIPAKFYAPAVPVEHDYVADGLVAMYDGAMNTRDGQVTDSTVWEDLIGVNNINVTINEKNYFTSEGLMLNGVQNYFPQTIVDVINGNSFTFEFSIADLNVIGRDFATIVNATADRFALFYRTSNGVLEFKFAGCPGPQRNIIQNALPILQDAVITITYEIGGNSIIYINGQHVSTMPAQGAFEAVDLFFGHKEETKLFSALFRGFRIYDRALTAEEVLHNFNVDAKTETPVEPVLPTMPEAGMSFDATLYHGIKTLESAPLTIEAWLKLDTAARAGVIYGNYSSANPPTLSVSLEIHENGVPRLYYTNENSIPCDVRFNDVHVNTGDWVHLVITYEAETNTLYCYVNGELAQTVNPAANGMNSFLTPTHAPMAVGGDLRNSNGQSFKGQLASVTVYGDLRTADEVKADMYAPLNAPNMDGLLAAYDLSAYGAGAPEDILDLSGNGYHITKGADNEIGTPAVENYLVPQSQWVITGHNTQLNDSTNPMVAAGGIESAALLHQGSIALGEIDLSKYSKVVVMWGCDNSDVTINHYNANANNRIMLLNAEMAMVMSPAEGTVIAGGTYELKGWKVTAFEIDLTGIDYNGPVWLAIDALPGTFALVASVEFIA